MRSATDSNWIHQDTAVLVIHGIGNQLPFETLDQFARTLAESYPEGRSGLEIEHRVAQKPRSGEGYWYDNYLRIRKAGSDHHLDIYEYYWANLIQESVDTEDINRWIRGVVRQAKMFYRRSRKLQELENGKGNTAAGRDRLLWRIRYRLFLNLVGRVVPAIQKFTYWIVRLLSRIPVAGNLLGPAVESLGKSLKRNAGAIIGDIIVYNTLDAKSKYYETRKAILDGAVSALRYLVEPPQDERDRPRYRRVVVAGHSQGSQISFDAINRLTHHMRQGNVTGYGRDGRFRGAGEPAAGEPTDADAIPASEILSGLVTFGSPLDKIAFFLWNLPGKKQYLRALILKNFHSFKQKEEVLQLSGFDGKENLPDSPVAILPEGPFKPIFNDIRWYNFYARRDVISGELHFYDKLRNIECDYTGWRLGFKNHNAYWHDKTMFRRIFEDFLLPVGPPKHEPV